MAGNVRPIKMQFSLFVEQLMHDHFNYNKIPATPMDLQKSLKPNDTILSFLSQDAEIKTLGLFIIGQFKK